MQTPSALDSLGQTIVLATLVLICWAGWEIAIGRRSPAWLVAAGMLELAAVVQAVLDVTTGWPETEGTVHGGYLVVSLITLPALAWWGVKDPGRWGGVCLVAGCVVFAVVEIRLRATGA